MEGGCLSVLHGVRKTVAHGWCGQSRTRGTHVCEEGEAAGEDSAMDPARNRLFFTEKKDTLRSVVRRLKRSGGSESNAQDGFFFP